MFILTIHYNHLFFVWLIMNCVDYQPNKKCPYINSPFYEIRIIIAQALINNNLNVAKKGQSVKI